MNVIQTTLKSLQIGAFATLVFASSCKKDTTTTTTGAPTITEFTPTSGASGTAVTITGTNFGSAENTTVQFNGTAATVTAITATSITTSVPTAATTGKITVAVSGTTATSATDFTVGTTGTTGTFDAFSYTNKSVVFGKKDSSIAPTATRTTTSALTYTITDIKFNDVSLATSSYAIIPGTGTNVGTSTVALNANVTTGTLTYPAYKTNIFKLKADGSVVISSWCAQGVYKLYVTASDGTNTKAAILTATITAPAGTITAVTYAAGTPGGNYAVATKTITITSGSLEYVTYATPTATKTGTFTTYYWIEKVTKDGTELYADIEDKRNALGEAHKVWLDAVTGNIGLGGFATIGRYVLSVRAGDGGNSIAVGNITVDLQSFDQSTIAYSPNSTNLSTWVPNSVAPTVVGKTGTAGTNYDIWIKSIQKGSETPITDNFYNTYKISSGNLAGADYGKLYWAYETPAGVYTIIVKMTGGITTTYTLTKP